MSAPELSDVTLALVDANVLACWEDKVKLGLECSLLLKHSEGKITTTLQYSSSILPPPLSQAEKGKKKKQRKTTKKSAKKLEALLAFQKRLVEEKGLPPSRLMLQHAAEETSCAPVSEPDQVSEEFKCEKCDFSSKSKRGLKTHVSRTHKEDQTPEVQSGEIENLRSEEHHESLNVSKLSEGRDSLLVNADKSVLSSTPVKENVGGSAIDKCVVRCGNCGERCPNKEALRMHVRAKHRHPWKCFDCATPHFRFDDLINCTHGK